MTIKRFETQDGIKIQSGDDIVDNNDDSLLGGGNANTGNITFDGNNIGVDGSYLQLKVQDGNDYSIAYQSSNSWEAYAENDEDGPNGAWAWIRADLSDGINSPKVFIENVLLTLE